MKIDQQSVELHKKFSQLGHERNRLTYELLTLLPEINRLKVYEKYGYPSIITYAGVVGGLSENVVKKRLNLEKHLENLPALKETVAKQGIHKVAIIASLATPSTEKEWVNRVKNMNKNDLQELAREIRDKENERELGLFSTTATEAAPGTASEATPETAPCQAIQPKLTIELDEETRFLFLKLKKKIKGRLSNKEALKRMLKKLDSQAATLAAVSRKNKKQAHPNGTAKPQNPSICKFLLEEKLPSKQSEQTHQIIPAKQPTHHIPREKERQAIEKYKGKCAYPGCTSPYHEIHHIDGFSKTRNHDNIIPLCKTHHNFAHNGLIANMDQPPEKWELRINHSKPTGIDKLFLQHQLTHQP